MYILYLNPVTANAERYNPVAWSDLEEDLHKLLESERLPEPEHKDGFFFTFKEGPLRMYNPPDMHGINCFGVREGVIDDGSLEDALRATEDSWNDFRNSIMMA